MLRSQAISSANQEIFEEVESDASEPALSSENEIETEEWPEIAEGEIIQLNDKVIMVGKLLGIGVFGKVFSAKDIYETRLAIKVQDYTDEDRRAYVNREVSFLMHVDKHGGSSYSIIKFLGDYIYGEEHLMIFERGGICLQALLENEDPHELKMCITIAKQVLAALKFLHSIKIVHLDVKPTNILVTSEQEIKLCDFGNSFTTKELKHKRGKNVIPLVYKAPEVYLGIELDEKLDLFSLGCTLAEVYTGYQLFPANNIQQLNQFHTHLLGIPDLRDATQWRKFFRLDKRKGNPRCFTEGELLKMGWNEPDERKVPINRMAQMVTYGYNQLHYNAPTTQDHLFVDFLEQLLEPNNRKRVSATEAEELSILQL